MFGLKGFLQHIQQYQKYAKNRPHPLMTKCTLFLFKNKNLFKNPNGLIFQLAQFL